MSVNQKELISSSILNAALWGPSMGLFALSLAFDHPNKNQIALACCVSSAVFSLMGSTVHYTISRIYQNEDDIETGISTALRTIRVMATTLLTPLTAMSLFTLCTQNIRGVRAKSLSLLKKCAQKRYIATFALSTLTVQTLFTHLFANSNNSTPVNSKKTITQLSASSFVAGSSLFFVTCFSLI